MPCPPLRLEVHTTLWDQHPQQGWARSLSEDWTQPTSLCWPQFTVLLPSLGAGRC